MVSTPKSSRPVSINAVVVEVAHQEAVVWAGPACAGLDAIRVVVEEGVAGRGREFEAIAVQVKD
jgi:hypothetical protein